MRRLNNFKTPAQKFDGSYGKMCEMLGRFPRRARRFCARRPSRYTVTAAARALRRQEQNRAAEKRRSRG